MWQVTWAEQWQYRANLVMYLLYGLVSPVVFLSVWTTVAANQNGIQGLSANDFVTYYLTLLIVDKLTSDVTIHILSYKIQDGTLSGELLNPVHPVLTRTLVSNLAYKSLTLLALLPIWILLYVLFRPDFSGVTPLNLLLAVPAILIGAAINFFLGAIITCAAFWTTRVYSLSEFIYAFALLFGGVFVPLDLLPPLAQRIAYVLPFQLYIYFPIQLILGKLSPEQISWNFTWQAVWLVLGTIFFSLMWREGVKRFSAVGA
jgi:ABC-2 type transport system permease protein